MYILSFCQSGRTKSRRGFASPPHHNQVGPGKKKLVEGEEIGGIHCVVCIAVMDSLDDRNKAW